MLEGLLAFEEAGGARAEARAARLAGEEHLLARHLLFRRSSGLPIDPRFSMPAFPTRWCYHVLRALDYFRRARPERDERCAEAVEVLRGRRRADGRCAMEQYRMGPVLLELEEEGPPSRWITLRALRVLRWWDAQSGSSCQPAAPASSVSTP